MTDEGYPEFTSFSLSSGSTFAVAPGFFPALERITGESFGTVRYAMHLSSMSAIEKAEKNNREIRRKWLDWWKKEGKEKYGK